MTEELLRQILDELRHQGTPAWLDALRIIGPMIGGFLAAAVGVYAVHQSNKTQSSTVRIMSETQLKSIEATAAAQDAADEAARRAAWRRDRYEELLSGLAEWMAALRMLTMTVGMWHQSVVQSDDTMLQQQKSEEALGALNHFQAIDLSSRVFAASARIPDKKTVELAQWISQKLLETSRGVVMTSALIQSGAVTDEKRIKDADEFLTNSQKEALEKCYELNARVEDLVSQAS